MKVTDEIVSYVKANYPIIWVETYDPNDLLVSLVRKCSACRYSLVTFDRDYGVQVLPTFGVPPDGSPGLPGTSAVDLAIRAQTAIAQIYTGMSEIRLDSDYVRAISRRDAKSLNTIIKAAIGYDEEDLHYTLFVHRNVHFDAIVTNPLFVQTLENIATKAKGDICVRNRIAYLPLGPSVNIPSDLKYDVAKVSHPLPDQQELVAIARSISSSVEQVPTVSDDLEDPETLRIIEAGIGLNRKKFEDAISLSIVKEKRVSPDIIWQEKKNLIKELGFIKLYEGNDSFEEIGGLDNYRDITKRLLAGSAKTGLPLRGQLLVGVPGAGKTKSAKCIANETGRRMFILDLALARSKWLGETNQNVATAIELVEAMQPSVLLLDEADKSFSGAGQSSAATDGGTGDRVLGQFLTWLNDHTSDVFVVFTANNLSNLPSEFKRNGRFDGIFFFDLPTLEERKQIWEIHIKHYFKFDDQVMQGALARVAKLASVSKDWTGADIEAACRQSAILQTDIVNATGLIIPLIDTDPEKIKQLRSEAEGRYLSANHSGVYQGTPTVLSDFKLSKGARRRNIENN